MLTWFTDGAITPILSELSSSVRVLPGIHLNFFSIFKISKIKNANSNNYRRIFDGISKTKWQTLELIQITWSGNGYSIVNRIFGIISEDILEKSVFFHLNYNKTVWQIQFACCYKIKEIDLSKWHDIWIYNGSSLDNGASTGLEPNVKK